MDPVRLISVYEDITTYGVNYIVVYGTRRAGEAGSTEARRPTRTGGTLTVIDAASFAVREPAVRKGAVIGPPYVVPSYPWTAPRKRW